MPDADRCALEALIAAHLQTLTAESDQIGQRFAGLHALTANDFRALLHVTVAEGADQPLSAGELRARMGTSGAAITYLVERMIASGHLLREPDPADRRRVRLRVADHGMAVARDFFTPLAEHLRASLSRLPDSDLDAADRVFTALVAAMSAFSADIDAELAAEPDQRSDSAG